MNYNDCVKCLNSQEQGNKQLSINRVKENDLETFQLSNALNFKLVNYNLFRWWHPFASNDIQKLANYVNKTFRDYIWTADSSVHSTFREIYQPIRIK